MEKRYELNMEQLMEGIKLPLAARQMVLELEIGETEFQENRQMFLKEENGFLDKVRQKEQWEKWALKFYLLNACYTYTEYKKKQIADAIYYDTMTDITIWCRECYRKKGYYGLEEIYWIGKSVKMELFRLGRLQFEPIDLPEKYSRNIPQWQEGQPVLNVHIPEGEALTKDSCLESFLQAESFFGDTFTGFLCDSWLLSPNLKEVLSENSRIWNFQKLFQIMTVHYTFAQAEQRIFKDILEDKAAYPEETSLQRAAKPLVLNGYDFGIGIGIREKSI